MDNMVIGEIVKPFLAIGVLSYQLDRVYKCPKCGEPLVTEENKQLTIMSVANILQEIQGLQKYKMPCDFGEIHHAIIYVAHCKPEYLEKI